MSDLNPPQYVAYPRDPRFIKNEAIDRFEALGQGVQLAPLPFLVAPFIGSFIAQQWFHGTTGALAAAAFLSCDLCFALAYYVLDKIGHGLRWIRMDKILYSGLACVPNFIVLITLNEAGSSVSLATTMWVVWMILATWMARSVLAKEAKSFGVEDAWKLGWRGFALAVDSLRIRQASLPIEVKAGYATE